MRPLGLQDLFWEEKGIGLPWASVRSSQLTCVALLLAGGRKRLNQGPLLGGDRSKQHCPSRCNRLYLTLPPICYLFPTASVYVLNFLADSFLSIPQDTVQSLVHKKVLIDPISLQNGHY